MLSPYAAVPCFLIAALLTASATAAASETDHRPARHGSRAEQQAPQPQPPQRPWAGVAPLTDRGACPADAAPGRTMNLLTIDGGGVRGIIPASVLAYVEARAGRPVADLFDLVAGASTGSLIAVALSKPGDDGRPSLAARQVAESYMQDVQRLFPSGVMLDIETTDGLLRPKFSAQALEALLQARLADLHLSELIGHVLVPTYDLRTNQARIFSSVRARQDPAEDFRVREMLRASTAAPSIYPPKSLTSRDGATALLGVDASLFVNNPAELAEAEARALWPGQSLTLLSLGTGVQSTPVVDLASDFGLVDWIPGLLYVVAYGQESMATLETVRQLNRDGAPRDRYELRLNTVLSPRSVSQFDASPEHMDLLLAHATALIEDNRQALDGIVNRLLCAKGD
jgi:uncharacterized protein